MKTIFIDKNGKYPTYTAHHFSNFISPFTAYISHYKPRDPENWEEITDDLLGSIVQFSDIFYKTATIGKRHIIYKSKSTVQKIPQSPMNPPSTEWTEKPQKTVTSHRITDPINHLPIDQPQLYKLTCVSKNSNNSLIGPKSYLQDLCTQLNKTSELMKLPIEFELEEIDKRN